MSNSIVQSAIEGRLKAWAAAQMPPIRIAFQNGNFTPAQGETYLRGFLMPANTKNPSQGGKHKHFHGMYQVSVFTKDGVGTGPADAITSAIEALFACPTTMPHGGHNVHVLRSPSTATGAPGDPGFWMVPVTIWYDMEDFT